MVEGGAKMLSEDVMLDALFTAHRRDAADDRDAGRAARERSASRSAPVTPPTSTTALRDAGRDARAAAHPRRRWSRRQARAPQRRRSTRQAASRRRRSLTEFPGAGARRSRHADRGRVETTAMRADDRRAEAPHRRPRPDRHPADHAARSACCRARTARRCSPAARRRRWRPPRSARRPTSRRSTRWSARATSKFMLHYNFPPLQRRRGEVPARPRPPRDRPRRARRARAVAGPAGRRLTSRTPSASSPRSSSRTARRRWPRCAAARLALMDAGVPIKAPVAGIAMGLIKEGDDIRRALRHPRRRGPPRRHGLQGRRHQRRHHRPADGHQDRRRDPRDHAPGAATRRARPAAHPRRDEPHACESPRGDISAHAPRIITLKINRQDPRHHRPRRQGDPRHRRGDRLQDRHRGRRHGLHRLERRKPRMQPRHRDHRRHHRWRREVGKIYKGIVRRIVDFGAFVEIMPGTDGLAAHLADRTRARATRVRTCSKKATRSW